MRVLIDLVYLVNVVFGILCLLTLCILIGEVISFKKLVFIGLFWGFHLMTLYSYEVIYYVWVIVTCLLFSRKHIIRNTILFIFIHETYLNSLSGIYRIGHVLILSDAFDWILPILIGSFVIGIYMILWFQMRKDVLNQVLIEDIQIEAENHVYNYRGFLDTGNQMLDEGVPVIYFRVNTTPFISHQKVNIYFKEQWQPCRIGFLQSLDVEADCLLNYYLL